MIPFLAWTRPAVLVCIQTVDPIPGLDKARKDLASLQATAHVEPSEVDAAMAAYDSGVLLETSAALAVFHKAASGKFFLPQRLAKAVPELASQLEAAHINNTLTSLTRP